MGKAHEGLDDEIQQAGRVKMAALPYIQLYVADFLADTVHLTAEETGAYLLLIFNYWQRGESFRANDQRSLSKRLASVARVSGEAWNEIEKSLSEFFEISETEWRHPRIDRDLEAVNQKSDKAKAAGKASAKSREASNNNDIERLSNERSTDVERTLNHKDKDTDKDLKALNTLSLGSDLLGDEPKNEGRAEVTKLVQIPYDEIVAAYHAKLPMLPAVRKLSDQRRRKLRARWLEDTEHQSVGYWEDFFAYASQSDFLSGRDGRWTGCDFEWLIEASNHLKVVEGKYENKGNERGAA